MITSNSQDDAAAILALPADKGGFKAVYSKYYSYYSWIMDKILYKNMKTMIFQKQIKCHNIKIKHYWSIKWN